MSKLRCNFLQQAQIQDKFLEVPFIEVILFHSGRADTSYVRRIDSFSYYQIHNLQCLRRQVRSFGFIGEKVQKGSFFKTLRPFLRKISFILHWLQHSGYSVHLLVWRPWVRIQLEERLFSSPSLISFLTFLHNNVKCPKSGSLRRFISTNDVKFKKQESQLCCLT